MGYLYLFYCVGYVEGSPHAKNALDSSSRFDTAPACDSRTRDDSACRAGISASRGKSGCRVQICGAFVYGALSFSDKLSSGVAIALIQQFSPRKYVAYPESIASVLSCVSLRTRSIRLYLSFLVN